MKHIKWWQKQKDHKKKKYAEEDQEDKANFLSGLPVCFQTSKKYDIKITIISQPLTYMFFCDLI